MITEQALQEAIAECQGERHPNASTCLKLAAYYTIRDNMFKKEEEGQKYEPQYSYASEPMKQVDVVRYKSDTEFSKAVNGMDYNDVLPIIDELMTVIQNINPRLYRGVMRKLGIDI